MEEKKKQERKVIHVQFFDASGDPSNEVHKYFGSIAQLFQEFTEEELGISYYQTKNTLKAKHIIVKDKCIIRQGILKTKVKSV